MVRCLVAGVLLAGPTALAFASGGFFDRARMVAGITAWALVALIGLSGAALPRKRAAWAAIAGLAGLAAWTAVSTSWAPLLEPARDDVGRVLAYCGALTASTLAWRHRADARLIEPLLAAGVVVVTAYGLSGRLLPGLVDLDQSLTAAGRLEQPLTYWNAMGALAAIGLTLSVRIAGDAQRQVWLRSASAAASPLLGLGVYLSFSRGAIAALVAGLLVLAALVPERGQIRAVGVAAVATLLAALAANLLPGVESLSGSSQERDGLIGLVVLVALATGCAVLQLRAARSPAREWQLRLPRRLAVAAIVIAAAAGVTLLALALDRGSGSGPAAAGAGRLSETGSNRYDYWEVALRSFGDEPLRGTGSAGFRVEWLREREIDETVQDAHSLYLETAAELGLVGLGFLALLIGGVAAAARAVLRDDRELAVGWTAAVVVFVVHAGIDWQWEMPAVTLPELVLAGALLARAEVVRPVGDTAS